MACSPEASLQSACDNGISQMSNRQLWILIASALVKNMGSVNPNQLIANACSNGISCLEDRRLLILIAEAVCEATIAPVCLLCGDGAPVDDPPCDCAIYYDKTGISIYIWTGQWIQISGGPL